MLLWLCKHLTLLVTGKKKRQTPLHPSHNKKITMIPNLFEKPSRASTWAELNPLRNTHSMRFLFIVKVGDKKDSLRFRLVMDPVLDPIVFLQMLNSLFVSSIKVKWFCFFFQCCSFLCFLLLMLSLLVAPAARFYSEAHLTSFCYPPPLSCSAQTRFNQLWAAWRKKKKERVKDSKEKTVPTKKPALVVYFKEPSDMSSR